MGNFGIPVPDQPSGRRGENRMHAKPGKIIITLLLFLVACSLLLAAFVNYAGLPGVPVKRMRLMSLSSRRRWERR